jgi:hypothetical protein
VTVIPVLENRRVASVLPQPVALASSYEVARRLQLERRQAQRLAEGGLLGPLYRTEGSVLVQADHLDALAERPFVGGTHPAALVVRVAPARLDEEDPERDYLGWHAALDQQQRWEATRGWWSVKQPDDVKLLVVVLCTFVVEILKVTGYDTGAGGKRRFHVHDAPDDGRPFRHGRLRTPPGGSTFLLEEQP